MRTAFIHVGMHKTGTSSIQQTLAGLDLPDHHYIQTGSPNHSLLFSTVFESARDNRASNDRFRNAEEAAQARADWTRRFRKELRENTKPNIVLSAEDLTQASDTDAHHEELRDAIAPHVDRFVVLGYARPQVSWMQSAFQQRVKLGRPTGFDIPLPKYRERYERIDRVFGAENVTVIPFRRDTLKDGDVVIDFAHRIGIDIAKSDVLDTNLSDSLEVVALRYANCQHPFSIEGPLNPVRTRNAVNAMMRGIGTSKFEISREVMDPILGGMTDDLAWILARMGDDIADTASDSPDAVRGHDHLLEIAERALPEMHARMMALLGEGETTEARVGKAIYLLGALAQAGTGGRGGKPRQGGPKGDRPARRKHDD